MKSFKNWKIATKIMSISIFTIIVVVLGMLFYFMPLMEDKLMQEKRAPWRTSLKQRPLLWLPMMPGSRQAR